MLPVLHESFLGRVALQAGLQGELAGTSHWHSVLVLWIWLFGGKQIQSLCHHHHTEVYVHVHLKFLSSAQQKYQRSYKTCNQ